MAKINLLNWREERRRDIEKQFYTMLVAGLLLGVGVVFGVQLQIDSMIKHQETRNNYIKSEIKKVEKAIAEIRELEKKKRDLLSRMDVIQKLQGDRSDIVYLLDDIVRVLPEGVHLSKLVQNKAKLTFNGVAQSNARVSAYMRNIEQAEWLKDPNLQVIQTTRRGGQERFSTFGLTASQASPADQKKKKG